MKHKATFVGLRAFTLIELLAVIAIIALLAALVIGTGGIAVEKQRAARMRGEHQKLVTGIEMYKAEIGTYPPDNIDTNNMADYRKRLGRNSLFYELSGCIFTNNTFVVAGKPDEVVTSAELKQNFGVDGVQNSARRKPELPFRGLDFKPSQFADVLPASGNGDVDILVTPLKGPEDIEVLGADSKKKLNPWLYDASSTNRHNLESYDLWAEYLGKKRTNVVGNWKE